MPSLDKPYSEAGSSVIKKSLLILAVFVISLLFSLLVTMPASVLWNHVLEPKIDLRKIGASVQAIDGSVWNGRVLLSYKNIPSIIEWELPLTGLVALALPLTVTMTSHGAEAKLEGSFGLLSSHIKLVSLNADLAAFAPLFERQRIQIGGELVARNVEMQLQDNKIHSATGRLSWSGGDISYPAGRESHERIMPAFSGKIATRDDGLIELMIKDDGGDFDVIEGSLLPDGVAMLQVKRRILDLADEPWSINSKERDVVFKVKKSIY